ncbi:epoxyqueuosine reductase [Candidatus Aerophobetes bacterium]|uniref:Epoxyqueuosine reductase n=1 Tax=Aerophobetes bacterium TaxID=2030807 RepID=A0A523UN97_UNCAE|nr:MAG: epoxyqueuosine reductase [Candidatus Aerophobetes bacterium]
MKNLKDKVKEFVLSKDADLVGIASVSRFDGAPDGHKPEDILPDAKTVIVCAKRFPNSVVMAGPATSYQHMMTILYNQLDLIAYEMAIYIEQQGGLAIAVPSDEPYYDWDPDKLHGRGDLSHKHAAQAAGLGRLGKNSLLITPEFGNRVQLVSVVTNLDLQPDPLVEDELCPSECIICIKSCPVKAITDEEQVNQRVCRSYMFLKLPKGQIIESCRQCRKVCPIGI